MSRPIQSPSIAVALGKTFACSPLTPEEIKALQVKPLVPHGVKCQGGCGQTLLPADPLPHICAPFQPSCSSTLRQMEDLAVGSVYGVGRSGIKMRHK